MTRTWCQELGLPQEEAAHARMSLTISGVSIETKQVALRDTRTFRALHCRSGHGHGMALPSNPAMVWHS